MRKQVSGFSPEKPFCDGRRTSSTRLPSKDDLVFAHGALKALAANLMKIANDVTMAGERSALRARRDSYPRRTSRAASIMPGKVNPTQCEAVTMVAVQVIGKRRRCRHGGLAGQFRAECVHAGAASIIFCSPRGCSPTAIVVVREELRVQALKPIGRKWPTTCTIH